MERYTVKIKENDYATGDTIIKELKINENKCKNDSYYLELRQANIINALNNKLGVLEDLEEQLGCPLEVVFKALKYGIKYKTTGKGNSNLNKEIIASSKTPKLKLDYETHSYLCFEITQYYVKTCFKLKDYKKTWWLKGDKVNEK